MDKRRQQPDHGCRQARLKDSGCSRLSKHFSHDVYQ
jgi:hypothetical protein